MAFQPSKQITPSNKTFSKSASLASPKITRKKSSHNFNPANLDQFITGRAFLFEQCFVLCTQIDNRTERLGFHCEFIIRTNKLEVNQNSFQNSKLHGSKNLDQMSIPSHLGYHGFVLRSKKDHKKLEHYFLCETEEESLLWYEKISSAVDILNNFMTAISDPKAAFTDSKRVKNKGLQSSNFENPFG